MSLGRRSANTLSTMLAMAVGSELEDETEDGVAEASCTMFSAPAATASTTGSPCAEAGVFTNAEEDVSAALALASPASRI